MAQEDGSRKTDLLLAVFHSKQGCKLTTRRLTLGALAR